MHEMAISCNIVEIVSEAAIGREVSVMTIEVGKLSCVALGIRFPPKGFSARPTGGTEPERPDGFWSEPRRPAPRLLAS